MEFLIMLEIFSTFLLEMEIYCQDRFQKNKSANYGYSVKHGTLSVGKKIIF